MARDKIGDDLMQVRFPDGTFDRIDELGSNRSEFIRCAVEDALAVSPKKNSFEGSVEDVDGSADFIDDGASEAVNSFNKPKRSKKADPAVEAVKAAVGSIVGSAVLPRVSSVVSPRAKDKADALSLIKSGRYSSRDLEKKFDWIGLRYANAEKALLSENLVHVVDGILVAVDE